jgi:hypothetical protein
MMTTGKPYPKEVIQKICEEVLNGKTKYRVAKEKNQRRTKGTRIDVQRKGRRKK